MRAEGGNLATQRTFALNVTATTMRCEGAASRTEYRSPPAEEVSTGVTTPGHN